jgi:glycosyltransferase involved in cell wall biosynthesis
MILILFVALAGIWMGKGSPKTLSEVTSFVKEKSYPLVENRSFVVVIYGYNQSMWCERALSSVFEQEFDHYRVIFVDDASTDGTIDCLNQYVLTNHQESKVILMRNGTKIGMTASLARAIGSCLDREIVIPLSAKDWLASPFVLSQLNAFYQNPDVWLSSSKTLEYPSYEVGQNSQVSFFAHLFKDAVKEEGAYLDALLKVAGKRARKMEQPISFSNTTCH